MPTKKQYEKRKAQGLCTSCGVIKVKKYLQCDTCREKQKNRKPTSQKRKEQGLCVKCGLPRTNKTQLCDSCRDSEKNRTAKYRDSLKEKDKCYCGNSLIDGPCNKCSAYQKDRRILLKQDNKCIYCAHPVKDGSSCSECREKRKNQRKELRNQNKCPWCQTEVSDGVYCEKCLNSAANSRKRIYLYRKDNTLCTRCGVPVFSGYSLCFTCQLRNSNRYLELKTEVIHKYGSKCNCCGIEEISFLSIDHINNDGAEHRKELGANHIYHWLKRNSYPDGFQTLCLNCNLAKSNNGNVCPHKFKINTCDSPYYVKYKIPVVNYYGGKCRCCNIDELLMLTIDHIAGDGALHRSRNNYGSLAQFIITNDYPEGFQLLCMNCNFAKHTQNGCPHKKMILI